MKPQKLGEWRVVETAPRSFKLLLRSCVAWIEELPDGQWSAWTTFGRGRNTRYPDRRRAESGAIQEVRAMFNADAKLLDQVEQRTFRAYQEAQKEAGNEDPTNT